MFKATIYQALHSPASKKKSMPRPRHELTTACPITIGRCLGYPCSLLNRQRMLDPGYYRCSSRLASNRSPVVCPTLKSPVNACFFAVRLEASIAKRTAVFSPETRFVSEAWDFADLVPSFGSQRNQLVSLAALAPKLAFRPLEELRDPKSSGPHLCAGFCSATQALLRLLRIVGWVRVDRGANGGHARPSQPGCARAGGVEPEVRLVLTGLTLARDRFPTSQRCRMGQHVTPA